ncbi:hypothetical protein [Burkholderia glumae]|uniref:hypothetical protein n=1 Tax=Burkholderia glumae TaxID=337 RepID=UPI00041987AF|nr:hypothetical protein [Burkholderia glumae]NVE22364.1 hypothetical protein [Burkholderia glumae]QKM53738.1 hypothetical protein CG017_01755 [Burkholderia glumae]UVS95099.1 hypothetical protein EFP19_04410 [Burkholderia glumae]
MREMKCKPGDLAIVTKCGQPDRIGLIETVLGAAGDGKHDWLTELQGNGIHALDVHTRTFHMCTESLMYDWNLTPIRGNSIDDDIDTKEPTQHDENEFRRFLNDLQSSTEKVGA